MRSADDLVIIFDECIEWMARGESLESCLQRYPTDADELRDLLITAQTLSSMAVTPPPPPNLMTRDKEQFLRAVAQPSAGPAVTTIAPQPAPRRTWLFGSWLGNPRPLGRPAIVGVTLLTVLALLVAMTALSINALPGDLFYPSKVAAETIDLHVKQALNRDQAAELQAAYDRHRADDIQKAIDLGRRAAVTVNGYVVYADERSLSLNTAIRVALGPELWAIHGAGLRQGTYVTVVGRISPDSPLVEADQIVVSLPPAGTNVKAPAHATAIFTATRLPTRRPVVAPPTRRPTPRPTRMPQPTATRIPVLTVLPTWTPTVTVDATTTPVVTPTEVTPTLTATPEEVTPTASPTAGEPTATPTAVIEETPTPTVEPPTDTPQPPTATPEPPTATPEPPPTSTPEPPPTSTPEPPPTPTPEPPTPTPGPPP